MSFSGTLEFGIQGVTPVALTGISTVVVNGTGGGAHLSSFTIATGRLAGTASRPLFNAAPISGLLFAGSVATYFYHVCCGAAASNSLVYALNFGSVSNGPGAFYNLSNHYSNFAGVMPLNGIGVACLFSPCSAFPSANLVVPLTPVGQGGTAAVTGVVNITGIGAPWFKGTVTVGTATAMGFQHGPASATLSSAAQISGVVSLVSPVFISTSLDAFPLVPAFARFTVQFIPEPRTLLLVGSGVMGLAVIRRRRMKK